MYTAKHEMGAQILNGELGATATRWRRTWLFSPLFFKKTIDYVNRCKPETKAKTLKLTLES